MTLRDFVRYLGIVGVVFGAILAISQDSNLGRGLLVVGAILVIGASVRPSSGD